jgi:hypothetical protein
MVRGQDRKAEKPKTGKTQKTKRQKDKVTKKIKGQGRIKDTDRQKERHKSLKTKSECILPVSAFRNPVSKYLCIYVGSL